MVYDDEGDFSCVVCRLTQEETLRLRASERIVAQIRFIDEDSQAYATTKVVINVEDSLYDQVIEYKGGSGDEPETDH